MGMETRNGESITANKVTSIHINVTETNQRPAFFVHCTVLAYMYALA